MGNLVPNESVLRRREESDTLPLPSKNSDKRFQCKTFVLLHCCDGSISPPIKYFFLENSLLSSSLRYCYLLHFLLGDQSTEGLMRKLADLIGYMIRTPPVLVTQLN